MAEEYQKVTMNLFVGDYDRLRQFYPDIGAGPVIRRIVRQYLEQCEAGATAQVEVIPEIQL